MTTPRSSFTLLEEMEEILKRKGKKGVSAFLKPQFAEGRLSAANVLFLAYWRDHLKLLDAMLDLIDDVNVTNKAGATPLYYGASVSFQGDEKKQYRVCEMLLKHEADPNRRHLLRYVAPPMIRKDETALMAAASTSAVSIVKLLLKYGADPSLRDADGLDAYNHAVIRGHKDAARALEKAHSLKPTGRSIAIRNTHPRLSVPRAAITWAIALLDAHAGYFLGGCPPGELSIVFLTDPALAKIHGDFMDDPTATDVITFEGDPTAGLAGEICVSADTAVRFVGLPLVGTPSHGRRQAPALQNSFASELTLYLVHGWLHLAGYDDLKPAKKRRMRAAEKRAMALLQKAKAIPAFRLV